ncbi:MAG: oligosaccharide flippase family protein [Methylophilus sp.]|nr:oligosaccharide flippase family protein [Methylophilus sp.]
MQTSSFKQRVIRSGLLILSGNAFTQIIRFLSNLVMAKLLAPEMFGLMALANVFIMGLNLFSDIGLSQILIQSKRSDERFVNTVWTLQVIRGWVIWVFSILVACGLYFSNNFQLFPVDSVYGNPSLPLIVVMIGLSPLIAGFESTKIALGNRNLNIKKNVIIALISQIVGVGTMLIWAQFSPTVWALVFGSIIGTMTSTSLSYLILPGKRNYFCWDQQVFDEILHFGKWIFVSSVMTFLSASSDRLLLGALVDAKSLGYYAIASLLIGAFVQLIGSLIHSVGFPALSETVRDNPDGLKKVFYKLRLPFDLVLLFACGFFYVTADTIISVLYDDRYQSVGWIFQILAIGLFEVRYRLAGECFMALGMPKLKGNLIFLNLVCSYILYITLYNLYGFEGAVWAVAGSALSTIPLILFYLKKFNILDWKKELIVLPTIIVGYVAGIIAVRIFNILF